MKVQVFAPGERLAPYVRMFQIVSADAETTRTLLPEPGIILGFRTAGEATLLDGTDGDRMPDRAITGLRARSRRMRTSAGGRMVFAKFSEAGAAAFFRAPLHTLFNATLSLDDLVPRADVERAASRIAEARDDAEGIARLEEFLLARWSPGRRDPVALNAARMIRAARGAIRIDALACALGVGQDALEKRFRVAVGASPKRYASIIRLRHAVTCYRPDASLAQLAIDAGYYDQAHFNRDLSAITGESPRRFFQAAAYC